MQQDWALYFHEPIERDPLFINTRFEESKDRWERYLFSPKEGFFRYLQELVKVDFLTIIRNSNELLRVESKV